ncbi:MAG: acyl-CoA thioesterase [Nitrospiria bacterium]
MTVQEKTVAESISEMTQLVLPNDTNMLKHLLGGTLMHWIDLIGAIVANRHCRKPIVTASMERIDFLRPIPLGHLVILKGRMQYAGKTSMDVGVEVFSENTLSGERAQASTAVLTYVAVDLNGRPSAIPKLILSTDEEKHRAKKAETRRAARLNRCEN